MVHQYFANDLGSGDHSFVLTANPDQAGQQNTGKFMDIDSIDVYAASGGSSGSNNNNNNNQNGKSPSNGMPSVAIFCTVMGLSNTCRLSNIRLTGHRVILPVRQTQCQALAFRPGSLLRLLPSWLAYCSFSCSFSSSFAANTFNGKGAGCRSSLPRRQHFPSRIPTIWKRALLASRVRQARIRSLTPRSPCSMPVQATSPGARLCVPTRIWTCRRRPEPVTCGTRTTADRLMARAMTYRSGAIRQAPRAF